MNRRSFLLLAMPAITGCASTRLLAETDATPARDYAEEPYPVRRVDRTKFAARYRPVTLAATAPEKPGSIVVDTANRQLSFVESRKLIRRYGVAVGASGHAWRGKAVVGRKTAWPAWYPTDEMHAQTPGLPRRIEPGPANPLGARALYLFQDGRDTYYRIHGTSEPWTIGTEASSGCIRMINEDVIDLYRRVAVGAAVFVV